MPVLAVTATATNRVIKDIGEQLYMQRPLVFRDSFNRPNLRFSVVRKGSPKQCDEEIGKLIVDRFSDSRTNRVQCGIVYCLSKNVRAGAGSKGPLPSGPPEGRWRTFASISGAAGAAPLGDEHTVANNGGLAYRC